MSNKDKLLKDAIIEELEKEHDLSRDEAEKATERIFPKIKARFSSWISREYRISFRKMRKRSRGQAKAFTSELDEITFERININLRLQHGIMALSVLILIFTGLPLKFHDAEISKSIIHFLGGIEYSSFIHRIAATFLIIVGLWHMSYVIISKKGRETFKLLVPKPQDAKDIFSQIKYFLHISDERPKFDKFSYVEKFDYWAVYWGMVIMIGSGLIMWFKSFILRFLPLWVTDIAKEAHSDEAMLATLAIVIWHFYNVHLNPHSFPINTTFITGKITARQMLEEHPLEFERLRKDSNLPDISAKEEKTS